MFDIGFSELFLIAVVALLVLGPERLPKAARFAGLWVRRARAQWYSVKSELENELAAEELKRDLRQTQDTLRQTRDELSTGLGEARNRLQREGDSLRREFDDIAADATAPAVSESSVTPEAADAPAPPALASPHDPSVSDPPDPRPDAERP
ncbi:Sec-independent protein translocase protein TatB [Lysobacter cavernae]|uniref:Sec-independent protein translocase protein TatB n=1 Tax=Lysobacter cavernae TaxID=1685901 RepID=A0ABV7RPI1_9GAMM